MPPYLLDKNSNRKNDSYLAVGVIEKTILSLYSLSVLSITGYKTIMKKVVCDNRANVMLLVLVSILMMKLLLNIFSELLMPNNQVNTANNIILGVIYWCLIGFAEEILFRGYILNELLLVFGKNRENIAILANGILFGLFHLVNIIYGKSYQELIVQIINAGLIGVFFAVMYLDSDSIWIVILLHALFNMASGLHQWIFSFQGSAANLPFFWTKVFIQALFYVVGIVVVVIYFRGRRRRGKVANSIALNAEV